jgi:hypothetical protein
MIMIVNRRFLSGRIAIFSTPAYFFPPQIVFSVTSVALLGIAFARQMSISDNFSIAQTKERLCV